MQAFDKAFEINPFIPVFICGYEQFSQVVEYIDDISTVRCPGRLKNVLCIVPKTLACGSIPTICAIGSLIN